MTRRGQDGPGLGTVLMILFALLVFGVLIVLAFKWYRGGDETIDSFSCSGTFGALGGETGMCMKEKTCNDPGATKADGYYYQYVGTGFGCMTEKEWFALKEEQRTELVKPPQFCCIQIPEMDNPITLDQIKSATCENMEEGEWRYEIPGKTGKCAEIDDKIIMDKQYSRIIFKYKPKSSDIGVCKVTFRSTVAPIITASGSKDTCYEGTSDGIRYFEFTREWFINTFTQTVQQKDYSVVFDPSQSSPTLTVQQ
jgi:hypothetical protein